MQWEFLEIINTGYSPGHPALPGHIPPNPQAPFYDLTSILCRADGNHVRSQLTVPDLEQYLAQRGLEGWQLTGVNTNGPTSYFFSRPLIETVDNKMHPLTGKI